MLAFIIAPSHYQVLFYKKSISTEIAAEIWLQESEEAEYIYWDLIYVIKLFVTAILQIMRWNMNRW